MTTVPMRARDRIRFPFVDLGIILAMSFIGWTAYRLAEIEPQISSDRQQSQVLPDIFKECKKLFRENIENPELARRESDLVWHDALLLKAEYLSVADRLQADLPELDSALTEAAARKGRVEGQRRMQELKSWLDKQLDRAGLERLEGRSKELKARIAGTQ